jgi:hypothetical protein
MKIGLWVFAGLGITFGIVAIVVAVTTKNPSLVHPTVIGVEARDDQTVRVTVEFKNDGNQGDDPTCDVHTSVRDQSGNLVTTESNTIEPNNFLPPGLTTSVYVDVGVRAGDAQYVTIHDVKVDNCIALLNGSTGSTGNTGIGNSGNI